MQADSDVDFSATAHELRLPLSHIKGFVSSLRRRDIEWDRETYEDFLAQIELETDRLAELVDTLLERTTRGVGRARQNERERQRTSPAALIDGGLDRVRSYLKGRSVEIDVPPGLPLVEVNAPAIERVIANLVHNALKYAPPNSHIRLSANAVGDLLQLRVEDDGPGISRRDREHIFKRFYRGERGHASGQSGSGLGLSICLSIVRAHRGCIWADPRPGGGARFTVVLPVATQEHQGQQDAAVDVRRIGRVRSDTPAHKRHV